MTTQALEVRNGAARLPQAASVDLFRLGAVFAASGYFRDARDEAQAVVKILAGQELGVGPMAAMTGIHIIDGKPALSARLMGALIRQSRRYDYRVKASTATECVIEFIDGGAVCGEASFTIEDAKLAGLAGKENWRKYPKAMLFARAMSQGFTMYCPDLSAGMPVYTPEELGADVDAETGEILTTVTLIEGEDGPAMRPHPQAQDTGGRRRGAIVWNVGGVDCVDKRLPDGGRVLVSVETCPRHEDKAFFLGPDADPEAWAHGKGDDKCFRHEAVAVTEEEAAAIDAEPEITADVADTENDPAEAARERVRAVIERRPQARPAAPPSPSRRQTTADLPGADYPGNTAERPALPATEPQLRAIYAIGKGALSLDEAEVDEQCLALYGVRPADLSRRQASAFMDALKAGPPSPAEMGTESAPGEA